MATQDRNWLPCQRVDPSGAYVPRAPAVESLPPGFPNLISAEMVWDGSTLHNKPEQYCIDLSETHIQELEDAVHNFEDQNLGIGQLSAESFVLPTLGPILRILAREIWLGKGFFVLRGIDPTRYSNHANVILYVGISSYIGRLRGRQDEYGNCLLHLTDLGSSAAPDNQRQAPYSSVGQPFHTDTGSILGLFAKNCAAHGGESKIVSSWKIYNEIRERRPDLIRTLAANDWIFDTFGQSPPYQMRPLVHLESGKVVFSFSRRPLLGSATSPRSLDIPQLSGMQVEALNMVQTLAERHALVLDLKPGQFLFWNNLGLLHARNGFTDSPGRIRHLLRLWVHNDELGWSIPRAIRNRWNQAFGDSGLPQIWPTEPITDHEYVTTQQRSSGHG